MIPLADIRMKALEIGFDDVATCDCAIPDADIEAWEKWVQQGFHGKMRYMENPLRGSPKELFQGAKNAILFVTHYKQEKLPFVEGKGLVASYARGRDYHHLHRKRLKKMIGFLEETAGETGVARGFSDSFPLLEKALFVKSGLGWFGKNTLLIHRRFGTFILLAGLLTSLDVEIPKPLNLRTPRCGKCSLCMTACPTSALMAPYQLDATKCLSYHLIESKEPIPDAIRKKNPGYVFGCDICQDVCPHNVRPPLSTQENFNPENGLGAYLNREMLEDLLQTPEQLYGTPLQRKGVRGLLDNL